MQTNSWHVLYVKIHLCKIYFALFQGSLTTAGRSGTLYMYMEYIQLIQHCGIQFYNPFYDSCCLAMFLMKKYLFIDHFISSLNDIFIIVGPCVKLLCDFWFKSCDEVVCSKCCQIHGCLSSLLQLNLSFQTLM